MCYRMCVFRGPAIRLFLIATEAAGFYCEQKVHIKRRNRERITLAGGITYSASRGTSKTRAIVTAPADETVRFELFVRLFGTTFTSLSEWFNDDNYKRKLLNECVYVLR